jgi:NAD(P)-dependent dehydrogenase (short-subunit alcohol dehydrogenase family)
MNADGLVTDLSGNVAIVVGAATGMGRRFALTLGRAGAAVVPAGRRLDRVEQVAEEIVAAGGRAAAVTLDLCDPKSIVAAVDFAEAKFGIADVLINSAATTEHNWATEVPLELVDSVIDTNFRGPFLTCTEVARRLIAAERPGRIVNISSVGIFNYFRVPPGALYSATKAGVKRLTETLASEWARYGINVNTIAPGLFRSEMSDPYIEEYGDKIIRNIPRRRFGEPEFLDSTLLYLVSPSSHAVTGACIIVDDGQANR